MKRRSLICATIFVLFGLARAQTPDLKPVAQQQQGSAVQGQDTQQNRNPPSLISALSVADATKKTESDKSEPQGETEWNIFGVRAKATDALLVLFTGALTVIGYFQVRWMRNTVNSMENSSERQLRAYVCISSLKVTKNSKPEEGLVRFVFTVELINAGKTPAYEVTIKGAGITYPSKLPDDAKFLLPKGRPPQSIATLGPQQSLSGKFAFPAEEWMTEERYDEIIKGGKCGLYVYGRIQYKDAFLKPWYTNFRDLVIFSTTSSPVCMSMDDGNDAS